MTSAGAALVPDGSIPQNPGRLLGQWLSLVDYAKHLRLNMLRLSSGIWCNLRAEVLRFGTHRQDGRPRCVLQVSVDLVLTTSETDLLQETADSLQTLWGQISA